jgi:uncharacterized radical SAM superfamily protein
MDNFEINLVNKYLLRLYPVLRIKDGKRFKRAIKITSTKNGLSSNKHIFLKSKSDKVILKNHLVKDVIMVFGIDNDKINKIVSDYINR